MNASKSPKFIKRELSSPQKRIHFSEFNSGKLAINNICVAYFLEQKNTTISELSHAIDQTFISYPSLRIRLTQEGTMAHQYQVPFTPCNFNEYRHFHNLIEFDHWASTLAMEKIPYWDSPLAEFFPFKYEDDSRGFVLRTHHIVSDAWTHQLIALEIFEVLNRQIPWSLIRKRKGSYWDFLKTDEHYNQSVRYDYDQKFWQEKLFPLPAKTGLFRDGHPRSLAAQRHQFFLSSDQSNRIKIFCDKESLSYSSFFLWVLSNLIHLRTGSDDFLLGMLTHNRISKSEKRMSGMFVSTIALRVLIDRNSSLWGNLQNLLGLITRCLRHQRFPLSGIKSVESEDMENVFDQLEIIYSYENVDVVLEHKLFFCYAENFPLIFRPSMRDGQDFKIEMDYRLDSISSDQVKSLSDQYITVLEAVLADKDRLLESTPWVSETNIQKVLNDFNKPVLPLKHPSLIHQLLEKQAFITPEKQAITFGDQFLTYKILNQKANQVAYKLHKELGTGEQLVALLMDRSPDLMVLLYGILKAGYAYIPLSKDHPVSRNNIILKEAGVQKLFTDNFDLLVDYEKCFLFADWDFSVESEENPNLQLEPDTLAYIIFTSGSSGTPKGVMLEHGAVTNRLHWMKDFYSLNQRDCFIQKTPYTFDVSVPELFGWPQNGGRLHLLGPGEEKDPSTIIKKTQEQSITIIHFVPSMLGIFLDYVEKRSITDLFKTVRIVICSGEALDTEIISRFWRFFDEEKVRLLNLYGPTEAAVEVTFHECFPSQLSPVPIGKPVTNTQLLVLSPQGEILPPGVQGELCIAGPCLARGYSNAPDLTEKAFTSHPQAEGKRIYKTGDLASWTEEGDLLYQGRMDNQVKIRGNRIEIGEIEEAMRSFPAVSDAVVLVQKDKTGMNVLAGHYCPVETPNLGVSTGLRKHLTERLPPYMIPTLWKEHREFELTSSGKTDRKLIKPVPIQNPAKKVIAAEYSIEAVIIEEWKKVLPIDDFTCDDDFFKIGGDSFGLINVFTYLEEKYQLTLQELFDHSTVNDLTRYILENKTISLTSEKAGNHDWEPFNKISQGRKKLFDYQRNLQILKSMAFVQNKAFKNILITGATGFFGIHMVNIILNNSETHMILLIRADSANQGRERFFRLWDHYFPGEELITFESRLIFLTGDLSRDLLGLKDELWTTLTKSVDSILHAGANVRHYGRYEEFLGTNIEGTKTLIELVKQGREKEIHYISTVSLHLLEKSNGLGLFFEDDFPDEPHLKNNYLESKWEAERLLRTSGVNVRYYRLGNLAAHSKTGIFQINAQDNAFFQSIQAYKKIGAVPIIDEAFIDLSFIDQSAEAVWTLMTTPSPLRCFHILNPHRLHLEDLARAFDLEQVEIGRFYKTFSKEKELFTHAAYIQSPELLMTYPQNDHTEIILKKAGHNWNLPELKHIEQLLKGSLKRAVIN